MYVKRCVLVFRFILILFFVLLLRFAYLQTVKSGNMAKAAAIQRISETQLEKKRGNILDRNGISFTNRTGKSYAVLKPLLLSKNNTNLLKISYLLNIDYETIHESIRSNKAPIVIEIDENIRDAVLSLNEPGVTVVDSLKRYDSGTIARHIIGYLNGKDQIGAAGIEKSYDSILKSNSISYVGIVRDGANNPVQGLGYRIVNSDEDKIQNIVLTLDYHIQKIAEDIMEKNNIKGAVVIEDVRTGDILAMASKPDYDQNDIGSYLHSGDNELFNRAVASYNAGSIFKIIDTALVLENNPYYYNRDYCSGFVEIKDLVFGCSRSEGHGYIDLEQAFASSCNSYFINLALELGSKDIINMASKFGLGKVTGLNEDGIDESTGNLPDPDRNFTDGDTANISIGQGDIMVTPVQVANIAAIIANDGIRNSVNLVDSIVDNEGNVIKNLRKNEKVRVISVQTARRIKSMMEIVTTENGTAPKANIEEYGGSGGKTGSAEGPYVNGEKIVHAWFCGYFPKETPRYAMSVFVENGKYGGEAAAPIFAEIAKAMIKKGY
mgnify:FL=1